jgi:hypothetical protein
VLDEVEVASLLERGFRGLARPASTGMRRSASRTKNPLSDAQRAFNRLQAGLRAPIKLGDHEVASSERGDPSRRGQQTEADEPGRGRPVRIGRRHRGNVQQR